MLCQRALILLMLVTIATSFPKKFCGDELSKILSNFCFVYNTPAPRFKRQVIKECCYNECSIRYLILNYCESYDSEALEKYLEELKKLKNCEKDKPGDKGISEET